MKLKSIAPSVLALIGFATAANAQVVPGTTSAILFESTITTENAPTVNGTRTTLTTTSVRFINRDILEAMRVALLLDNTLTGWSLVRLANAAGTGNLYATKPGKIAVAVPANLLTQPVIQGTATTGKITTPVGGTPKRDLFRKVHATLDVKGGASAAFGNQILRTASFVNGATVTPVATQIEHLNISGKSGTGTGIVTGSFRIQKASPVNLAPLLPPA